MVLQQNMFISYSLYTEISKLPNSKKLLFWMLQMHLQMSALYNTDGDRFMKFLDRRL